MAVRFAGVAYVNINGTPVPLRANLVVHASKTSRAGIAGMDGVHGFSETPVIPAIELDMSTLPDVDIEAIDAMQDETVIAQMANGWVFTLSEAWKAGPSDINAAEGSTRVRFEGTDIQAFRS